MKKINDEYLKYLANCLAFDFDDKLLKSYADDISFFIDSLNDFDIKDYGNIESMYLPYEISLSISDLNNNDSICPNDCGIDKETLLKISPVFKK